MGIEIEKVAALVGHKIITYCNKIDLFEPIASVELLRSKLCEFQLTDLEAYLRGRGTQWERVTIVFKDAPARVECNTCGTRFNAHEDWWPCPDCGNPGAFHHISPYRFKLKEILTERGFIHTAKRNTVLL